jgi:catechol 2,3-dioxygenase-like lactoylglutathione lyase family enzyme
MSGGIVERIDHFVLTVRDLAAACDFYSRVLGAEIVPGTKGPTAALFGRWKINLHEAGHEFEPKASRVSPGSGDFCLITTEPIDEMIGHLKACGVAIELGPVPRIGALGPMTSVYFRDPDGNLVEIAKYA